MEHPQPLEILERREQNWWHIFARYALLKKRKKAAHAERKWRKALDACRHHPGYRDLAETIEL